MYRNFILLYLCFFNSSPIVLAEERQSIKEWETILKEINKIENIVTDTTTLKFIQGCSVVEEFKNEKGEVLSHRFDCQGQKLSVVYQGTFAILFLEDKQEIKVIDLSVAKDEMGIKKMVVHLFDKSDYGLGNAVSHSLTNKLLVGVPAIAKTDAAKKTVFRTFDSVKKHFAKEPVPKFSMNEFSSLYRNSNLTDGENIGKLSFVVENNKINLTARHKTSNLIKSFSLSFIPILGSYFSSFYLQVERGEMFHAGKTLKLIDDFINTHPEELGFLKGHTAEDRDKSMLLFTEIAKTSNIDPMELQNKFQDLEDQKIENRSAHSESFYKELHKSDLAIRKRQEEENQSKKKGFFGRLPYAFKKLITKNDSRFTIGDVYEDYIDKYSREPLERINPALGFLNVSILFRNEAVHAGYLAETYYRQNQKNCTIRPSQCLEMEKTISQIFKVHKIL